MTSVKLHEMVKYHSETDASRPALYTAVFVLAMNPARYEALPADLKAVIDRNSGAVLSQAAGRAWDASQASARRQAVDRGNVFYTVPAAEVDRWIKASSPLYDDWTRRCGVIPRETILAYMKAQAGTAFWEEK